MNKNIALLSKAPRGTAWHSRLVPFDEDVRRLREAGKTYVEISDWLREQGLIITASAVHSYVSVRVRRGTCENRLPATLKPLLTAPSSGKNASPLMPSTEGREELQKSQTDTEEFVFLPPETKKNGLQDEDFNINDPLA